MAICDVYRPEPVPNALDYSGALGSVEGMYRFTRELCDAEYRTLRDLAMGRQVAECIGNADLAEWCAQQAEREYHVASLDDADYARYQLARMDIAELIPLMDMKGHMGWHVACRLAEFAFKQPDESLLERAVTRLSNFSGVDPALVDPQLEYVLADVAYGYLLMRAQNKNRMTAEQKERIGKAMMRAKPEFRQRAALDLCRMYLGIHYGEAA